MDAIDFIKRIEGSGFTVALSNGNLAISPAADLNDRQRDFIRSNKDEMVSALRSSRYCVEVVEVKDVEAANNHSLIVRCWTPSGTERLIEVDSVEQALFVQRMNPKPPMVSCADCDHAAINSGIASCLVGVDSRLPINGYWATERHLRDLYELGKT